MFKTVGTYFLTGIRTSSNVTLYLPFSMTVPIYEYTEYLTNPNPYSIDPCCGFYLSVERESGSSQLNKNKLYKDVRRLNVVISTYVTLIEAVSLNFDKFPTKNQHINTLDLYSST